jgi:hypothetical protein
MTNLSAAADLQLDFPVNITTSQYSGRDAIYHNLVTITDNIYIEPSLTMVLALPQVYAFHEII